jgi:serine/threonine protein kinase
MIYGERSQQLFGKSLKFLDHFMIKLMDDRANNILRIDEILLAQYTLRQELDKRAKATETLDYPHLRQIIRDTLTCVYFLHVNQRCHFNIKPDSILYDAHLDWYTLFDYDASVKIDANISLFTGKATGYPPIRQTTRAYEAPEFIAQVKAANPYKYDIFSMGIILLEAFAIGRLKDVDILALNRDLSSLKKMIRSTSLRVHSGTVCEGTARLGLNILPLMLAEDPEERWDVFSLAAFLNLDCLRQSFQKTPNACNRIAHEPDGRVRVTYLTGFKYEGTANGRLERVGQGRLLNRQDAQIYDGEWKEDLPEGVGAMNYSTAICFTGQFSHGRPGSSGKLLYNRTMEPEEILARWSLKDEEPWSFPECADGLYAVVPQGVANSLIYCVSEAKGRDFDVCFDFEPDAETVSDLVQIFAEQCVTYAS